MQGYRDNGGHLMEMPCFGMMAVTGSTRCINQMYTAAWAFLSMQNWGQSKVTQGQSFLNSNKKHYRPTSQAIMSTSG